MNDRMLTTRMVASQLGRDPGTVRRWIKAGKLRSLRPPGTRDYLIPSAWLDEFLGVVDACPRRRSEAYAVKTAAREAVIPGFGPPGVPYPASSPRRSGS